MFSGAWNFVKRHKRKFIFTGVFIGGAWALGKYAKKKLLDFQEREAEECLAHARRQHHFDSNQRTCNMTVLSMLSTLRESVRQALDNEALTEQLKAKPDNKVQIWEELKILSFTRTITVVYSLCILISVLRVQLNIIGGFMYLDSMVQAPEEHDEELHATPRIQERYLATIQYVLNKGLADLIKVVQAEVTKAIGSMSLKQPLSLTQLQDVMSQVRNGVEFRQTNGYHDAGASSLVGFMMNPEAEVQQQPEFSPSQEEMFLDKLQQETRDMLESGDFHSVLTTLLDSAFMRLIDTFAEYYKPTLQANGKIESPNDISMPVARVIPIANGLLYTLCADAPNPFVQELLLKEQVKDFAANIYEAFSQPGASAPLAAQHLRS